VKISKEALAFLKHCSLINPGIAIDGGASRISSTAIDKTCVATALVPDIFPKAFCFADLSQFLAAVSFSADLDFEFGEDRVVVSDPSSSLVYFYGARELVKQDNKVPSEEKIDYKFSFAFPGSSFKQLLKASAALNLDEISFSSKKGEIIASACNPKSKSSSSFSISLGSCGESFSFSFQKKNLKLIPDYDYFCRIDPAGIAAFIADGSPYPELKFFIPVEAPALNG
jgi:hypothetical protein